MTDMKIMNSEKLDDVVVASFDENVSKFNALVTEDVKKDITSLYAKSGTKLALNLDGIKYIDSTGFGVFLSALKTARNTSGHFKIYNVKPDVYDLFKLLQLHNVFEIYDNLEDCLNSFN